MKNNQTEHFASESDQKAAVVERFNRTMKTRIWVSLESMYILTLYNTFICVQTYLSAKRTRRWIDVLPQILRSYNASYHRSIKMAPEDVTKEDEERIWVRLFGDGDTELKRHRITDGSKVRINRVKGVFEKGYLPNWSREQFTATASKETKSGKRPVYKLKDDSGEDVRGKWYPEELQAISENDYDIEKVLKRRTLPDGTRELFVKWLDYPSKYNSWIRDEDISK